MDLQETIRKILREESISRKEKTRALSQKFGLSDALKVVGGAENYIKLAYDGDIREFFKNENVKPFLFSKNDDVMFISDFIIDELNLETGTGDRKKILGKFRYGRPYNKPPYSVDAYALGGIIREGLPYSKVAAMGGTRGFGFTFIQDILGITYRQQIFEQIIDKYNLNSYLQ
jgi:hypothetical protein